MAQFLYHDAGERERLLTLSMRLLRPYAATVALMSLAMLSGIGTFGWVCLVPLAIAASVYVAFGLRMRRARRPELLLLTNSAGGILASLVCIALAHGPREYLFTLPAFPMLTMAPLFARRVTISAALLTAIGLVAVAMATYGPQVAADPPKLILPVMLMLVVVLGAMASRDAEDVNRSTAVVDPLTGLLNRVALQTRASELALDAAAGGARPALLIADVDHFKAVNDRHGHAAGDAVLIEIADRLRATVATAGGIYRFGGEEFVVLMPDATPAAAIDVAERIREIVAATPVAGISLTVSVGVAAGTDGAAFDYRAAFADADRALYLAKSSGRDRVCGAALSTVVEPIVAPARRATDGPRVPTSAPTSTGGTSATADPGWGVRLRGSDDGNWLVADGVDRGHVVDLLERSAKDSETNSAIVLATLLVSGLWLHWWGLIPSIAAGVVWQICTRQLPKARRPEFAILAGLVMLVAASGVTTALADRPILYALPMGALFTLGAAASFRKAGATVIGATAVVTTVATALVIDPRGVAHAPFILIFSVCFAVSTVILGEAMGRSAREHRIASITDGLTGALNRAALEARIPLIVQQSTVARIDTSVLVIDIDHFKRVNDTHGHDAGDAVLVDVARRLRGALRAFDSMYRVGGEEFVVLLVAAGETEARGIAERMRRAVADEPVAGLPVTVSVGAATAAAGRAFDYDATFAVADEHLYVAKQSGRDRVVVAADVAALQPLAQAA
ncbi:MAG: diguanylate cyclase [Solirubrobacteraceae bacterium]